MKQAFVSQYYKPALQVAKATGISPLFILAQSGLETGWGETVKGNMLFGIKKGAGINYGGWQGDTQLLPTTEYANSPLRTFPYIYPSYPKQLSNGRWKYKVKAEFRAYPSAYHSFMDWVGMLTQNPRYQPALTHKKDPFRFAEEITKAGYATDPKYSSKIQQLIQEISTMIRHKPKREPAKKKPFRVKPILIFIPIIVVVKFISDLFYPDS